jgi:hypothetical protein
MAYAYVFIEGRPPRAATVFGPKEIAPPARMRIARLLAEANGEKRANIGILKARILKALEESNGHQ